MATLKIKEGATILGTELTESVVVRPPLESDVYVSFINLALFGKQCSIWGPCVDLAPEKISMVTLVSGLHCTCGGVFVGKGVLDIGGA